MEASLRIREEAEERADAIKDLRGWIDRQQKQKSGRKAAQPGPSSEQDRRTSASASGTRPKQATITQRSPAAGDFFSRWEGFDADAALAEADNEAPPRLRKPQSVPSQQPRDWTPADCLQPREQQNGLPQPLQSAPAEQEAAVGSEAAVAADAAREAGNEAFKRGDMQAAEEAYTRSIQARPSAPALANRAAVRLRRKNWAAAEADASAAVGLDPGFLKGWHRRGTARREQGLWLPAAQDFEEALRLEPGNKALQSDRAACLASWQRRNGKGRAPASARISIGAPEPAAAAVQRSQSSNAAAAGVTVAAAGSSSGSSGSFVKAAGGRDPAVGKGQAPVAAREVAGAAHREPAAAAEQPSAALPAAAPPQPHAAIGGAAAAAKRQPAAAAAPQEAAGGRAAGALAGETLQQLQALGVGCTAWEAAPSQPGSAAAVPAAGGVLPGKSRRPAPRQPPRTGVEFETAWRSLRADPEGQAAYLRLLDAAELPRLLKAALTAQLLASIAAAALRSLGGGGDAGNSLALLQALPRVPRFGMAAMSLSGQQRAELAALWAAAEQSACGSGGLAELRAAYGLQGC